MSRWDEWTEDEYARVRVLIKQGLTTPEIAERIGRPRSGVAIKVQRVCGGNPNYRLKITKHKHLRVRLLRYYKNHTAIECQKHFGLTQIEFKSCLTVAYKLKSAKHIRKETRDHSPWSADQLKFLLQHAGLRPRQWIVERVGRGKSIYIVKERLMALGLASRNLQGITLSQFRQAFGKDPDFFLQTDAGPKGLSGVWLKAPHWKIVPWVWLDQEIKAKRLHARSEFRILISTHAMFQEWIFEGNALKKMKKIVREARPCKKRP